jgi:outer membrane murein-binding lipoprotein Lpp
MLIAMLVVAGCGSSQQPPPKAAALMQQQSQLKSKLDAMTPQQRAAYVMSHQDEVAAAAGNGVKR